MAPIINSAPDDFDFIVGAWNIHHHRLNHRLVGETEWTDFEGTAVGRLLFSGLGNMDENVLDMPSARYEAATVRIFDPRTRQWAIWWIDARNDEISSPVRGTFVDGVGTFYGQVVHNGVEARVRFCWSDTRTPSPKWAQAYSVDGGATWETNWIMRFERPQ